VITYLDMTFCPFYRSCKKGNNCHRALTPEVIEKAQQWFRGNKAPILQYTQEPPCYVAGRELERHTIKGEA
jgi:hypothetical protein